MTNPYRTIFALTVVPGFVGLMLFSLNRANYLWPDVLLWLMTFNPEKNYIKSWPERAVVFLFAAALPLLLCYGWYWLFRWFGRNK